MLWIEFKLNLELNEIEGQLLLPPVGIWLAFQIISPHTLMWNCIMTSNIKAVGKLSCCFTRTWMYEGGREGAQPERGRERGSEQRKQEIYGSKIFSPFLVIIRSASAARRGRTDGGDAAKFLSTPSLPPHYKNIPQQPREVRLV